MAEKAEVKLREGSKAKSRSTNNPDECVRSQLTSLLLIPNLMALVIEYGTGRKKEGE
jgi:hypothetical protein